MNFRSTTEQNRLIKYLAPGNDVGTRLFPFVAFKTLQNDEEWRHIMQNCNCGHFTGKDVYLFFPAFMSFKYSSTMSHKYQVTTTHLPERSK